MSFSLTIEKNLLFRKRTPGVIVLPQFLITSEAIASRFLQFNKRNVLLINFKATTNTSSFRICESVVYFAASVTSWQKIKIDKGYYS